MKHFCFSLLLILTASCRDKEADIQTKPEEIPVYEVTQQDIPIYREQVGQIYGLQDIPIRARVDGLVEKIFFEEGSRVKKGELLYSIDPDPYLAEVAAQESLLAQAQTLMVNAKNELQRYIPLAEMNAVSQSDLDAAQATYEASKASVEAARANLKQAQIRLGYCSIKAPIDGLIGATMAREGEYVGRNPNPVILNTVSRIDTARVQFSISEARYLELFKAYSTGGSPQEGSREVQEGRLEPNVELILADGSLYEEKGSVDFVNSQINTSTASLLIQASFPNPSGILRPGLYAKVRLKLTEAKNAILIPQRCLSELQGEYSVMVVDKENTIDSRPVEIGQKIGDMVIITKGLGPGDRIVVDALQKVRRGMKVEPVPAEFKSQTTF
jgi:membrane fusion protein (multidrug efflux system)